MIGVMGPNVFAKTVVTIEPVEGSGLSDMCTVEKGGSGCFTPNTITIKKGDSIQFFNSDDAVEYYEDSVGTGESDLLFGNHRIVSGDPLTVITHGKGDHISGHFVYSITQFLTEDGFPVEFNFNPMEVGESHTWKPTKLGSFPYFCEFHPWMQGLIIVEDDPDYELFTFEVRENDSLVPKSVDTMWMGDSIFFDPKLHDHCLDLFSIFETLGAQNFKTMYATDAAAQKCLVKTSEELERIEELKTENSVFIIISDKLENQGNIELILEGDLIYESSEVHLWGEEIVPNKIRITDKLTTEKTKKFISFTSIRTHEESLINRPSCSSYTEVCQYPNNEKPTFFVDFKINEEYTLTAINGDYFTSLTWIPLPSLSIPIMGDETSQILKEEEFRLDETKTIPSWIKNNAGWWADGTIDDNSFVQGIEFLVKEGIIVVDSISQGNEESKEIPTWIKNNAGWWADGTIDDSTFITGLEFLVKEGIIFVN